MEGQSVYSTSIEDNRYMVRCLSVSGYVASERFIVDTGAKYTCCHYRAINRRLREEHLCDCAFKNLGGIINGVAVKFYRYHLKQFTIGNIDMREQDIWLTFDERVTDIILGLDILKQIFMVINPYDERAYFCKDQEDFCEWFGLSAG